MRIIGHNHDPGVLISCHFKSAISQLIRLLDVVCGQQSRHIFYRDMAGHPAVPHAVCNVDFTGARLV